MIVCRVASGAHRAGHYILCMSSADDRRVMMSGLPFVVEIFILEASPQRLSASTFFVLPHIKSNHRCVQHLPGWFGMTTSPKAARYVSAHAEGFAVRFLASSKTDGGILRRILRVLAMQDAHDRARESIFSQRGRLSSLNAIKVKLVLETF